MSEFDDWDWLEDLCEDVDEDIARSEVKDVIIPKRKLSKTENLLCYILALAIFLFCIACGFSAI